MRMRVLVPAVATALLLVVLGFALSAHEKSEPIDRVAASTTVDTRCDEPARAPTIEQPAWYTKRRATVFVDSVLLGGMDTLRRTMPRWKFAQVGRPALMVHVLDDELRASGRAVAPLAILGVGYNSLWERNRRHYRIWAREFDKQAKALLATLKRAGAQQFVWVTLRHARRSIIPTGTVWQFDKYSWYFPYVNERLKRLDERRGDLALADWAKISNKPGLTYDSIHLNPKGATLMARTIKSAIRTTAAAETLKIEHPRPGC